nr:hypothetical protein CFP56_10277 [Quercus suber]
MFKGNHAGNSKRGGRGGAHGLPVTFYCAVLVTLHPTKRSPERERDRPAMIERCCMRFWFVVAQSASPSVLIVFLDFFEVSFLGHDAAFRFLRSGSRAGRVAAVVSGAARPFWEKVDDINASITKGEIRSRKNEKSCRDRYRKKQSTSTRSSSSKVISRRSMAHSRATITTYSSSSLSSGSSTSSSSSGARRLLPRVDDIVMGGIDGVEVLVRVSERERERRSGGGGKGGGRSRLYRLRRILRDASGIE